MNLGLGEMEFKDILHMQGFYKNCHLSHELLLDDSLDRNSPFPQSVSLSCTRINMA